MSKLLGVPAFYIEDRIEMLDKCGAITQPTQKTILTDILIYDESVNQYDDIQLPKCFAEISDSLWDKMQKLTTKTLELGIYTAGKAQDELSCLFCIMALDHFFEKQNPMSEWIAPPERFDGGQWEFSAETENYKNISPYNNRNWIDTQKHTIGHIVYVNSPFESRRAMREAELTVCEKIIKGITVSAKDEEAAATAIKDGILKKSGGKLELNVPYFSIEQYERFRGLLHEIEAIIPSLQKQAEIYGDGYRKLFPKHLKNKVDSSGISFQCLVRKGMGEWAKDGKINIPSSSICDVLVEHDGGMFFKI